MRPKLYFFHYYLLPLRVKDTYSTPTCLLPSLLIVLSLSYINSVIAAKLIISDLFAKQSAFAPFFRNLHLKLDSIWILFKYFILSLRIVLCMGSFASGLFRMETRLKWNVLIRSALTVGCVCMLLCRQEPDMLRFGIWRDVKTSGLDTFGRTTCFNPVFCILFT